jgi:hypothetical protein
MMSSPDRSAPIHSFMRSRQRHEVTRSRRLRPAGPPATEHRPREAAPRGRNFRVETLISIRLIAHLPRQSSAGALSQLGSISSWPRGRPRVRPQRWPRRPSLRAGEPSAPQAYRLMASNAAPPISTFAGQSRAIFEVSLPYFSNPFSSSSRIASDRDPTLPCLAQVPTRSTKPPGRRRPTNLSAPISLGRPTFRLT